MTIGPQAAPAALFFAAALIAAPLAAQDTPAAPVPQVAAEPPAAGQPGTATAPDMGTAAASSPAPLQSLQPAAQGTETAAETRPSASPLPAPEPRPQGGTLAQTAGDASGKALEFLRSGGPSIWAIAALSVITLALILWKIWRLALIGAWSRGKAVEAVAAYERGDRDGALSIVAGRRGIRSLVTASAITALGSMPEDRAREETARVAKLHLARAASGLGALELIATIAPLLGLLGTVLGMIAAFQALQAAGTRADPALLAGGIWEALLTTAAGMAVAIPASAALTWFEAVIGRIRRDVEDSATRLFVAARPAPVKLAAE